ncbi:MAG: SMC-Scp complex subunit ScpB [Gammaproteobacteria bacterium]|jgi:segregation and condensation protein B|uniref:SMC-Scp complex subunit ScpB n=1 Tax=SAR86 cluster bacterium TaxID=2030880 RepID=A0A838YXC1_9GAMM|nr:SMC-Scp complex subunit ScpB [SAR86 cluster bacterium]|tara:strand:+ start:73 stop:630 length:558 start_codon:yes stop_codon:yes gene_type:complete
MNHEVVNTIEALLFGAGRPLRLSEIRSLLDNSGISEDLASIKKSINLIEERYQNTSLEIKEVSSGYRLQIKESYSPCLSSLWNEKAPRISKALMETISIIAYKQPVTRGDIEDIRGVHVSTSSIRSLLEREWIKVSGFRDVPGRPALYVTTKQFLDDFNMKSISSLPELPEPVEHNNEELLSEVV